MFLSCSSCPEKTRQYQHYILTEGFRYGAPLSPTLYLDGFQRMGDPQQQSVRVEGEVHRHVPGDRWLRCGQEEVDRGLSGEPGVSLKRKLGQLGVLVLVRVVTERHREIQQEYPLKDETHLWICAPEGAGSRPPPAGSNGGLCPALLAWGKSGPVLEQEVKHLRQVTGRRHWSTAASRPSWTLWINGH